MICLLIPDRCYGELTIMYLKGPLPSFTFSHEAFWRIGNSAIIYSQ